MSDAAPHASPRTQWKATLRAGIAAGDALIRNFDPAQARVSRKAPHPNPPPQAGEGVARSAAGEGQSGDGDGDRAHRFAKDQLKAFFERIKRLQDEKKAIGDDIADVYKEVKVAGFDVKALREVVRISNKDINERKEQESIIETYLHALGLLV